MKLKKVDFLIRYEHKVRELESIMLIRFELERRGYSVEFIGNYEYKVEKNFSPKVFIYPAIYNNDDFKSDLYKYGKIKKIANLMWEQVFTIDNETDPNFCQNIVGIGSRALNLCWGNQSRDRIIRGGAAPYSAIKVGQINLDLLRGKFKSALKSKSELAHAYGIDINKRWQLFISSFAYCDMDDLQIDLILRMYGNEYYNNFKSISDRSRKIILDWFENSLKNNPDTIIIYRPHPDEIGKKGRLIELKNTYPNFYIISELALKHWINASDKILNWYSTGIIDGIVLNKPWRLLRPIQIDEHYDYNLMYNAKQINDEDAFREDFSNYNIREIIDKNLLESYYHIDQEKYSYLKICDCLEDLYRTSKYDIKYTIQESLNIFLTRLRFMIVKSIKKFAVLLIGNSLTLRIINYYKNDSNNKWMTILDEGYEKNVINSSDIEDIESRIKHIVYE